MTDLVGCSDLGGEDLEQTTEDVIRVLKECCKNAAHGDLPVEIPLKDVAAMVDMTPGKLGIVWNRDGWRIIAAMPLKVSKVVRKKDPKGTWAKYHTVFILGG